MGPWFVQEIEKKGLWITPEPLLYGDPNGTRTRVIGVRGRRPRPLDDGTNILAGEPGFEPE